MTYRDITFDGMTFRQYPDGSWEVYWRNMGGWIALGNGDDEYVKDNWPSWKKEIIEDHLDD